MMNLCLLQASGVHDALSHAKQGQGRQQKLYTHNNQKMHCCLVVMASTSDTHVQHSVTCMLHL